MWKAVAFIDTNIDPIYPFETSKWQDSWRSNTPLSFWRMYIVIRYIKDGEVVDFGISQSKKVWNLFGFSLRKFVSLLAGKPSDAYIYDYSVRKDSSLYLFESSLEKRWLASAPGTLGATKSIRPASSQTSDIYRLMDASNFVSTEWPNYSSGSSTALFFCGAAESNYLYLLNSYLECGNFQDAENLMYGARFNILLLSQLLEEDNLYAFAFSLTIPETSDLWLFLPQRVGVEESILALESQLRPLGIQLFISGNIHEYYEWQVNGVLPSIRSERT